MQGGYVYFSYGLNFKREREREREREERERERERERECPQVNRIFQHFGSFSNLSVLGFDT